MDVAWILLVVAGLMVWAGIGAVVTVIMGVVLYRDPMSPARVFFAVLLVAGIVGLHLTTGGH